MPKYFDIIPVKRAKPVPKNILKEALEVKHKIDYATLPESILDGVSIEEYLLEQRDPKEYGRQVDGDGRREPE